MIVRQTTVDPGDAAPPNGAFDPAANFDQSLSPGMRAVVRGEKTVLVNTSGLSDEEELNRVLDNIEKMESLKPKLTEMRDSLKAGREAQEEAEKAAAEEAEARDRERRAA